MASRAEERTGEAIEPARGPARPVRLAAAIRASLTDYYFNSMRLVPANVGWGAGLVVLVMIGLAWPPGGLLLLPLLALPTAGVFRLAARIVRTAPDPGLRDVAWPYRHAVRSTVALGSIVVVAAVVLSGNVLAGIAARGDAIGWVLATLAAWGLVALWAGLLVTWPLVVDPARDDAPLREKLRLAGALLLLDPMRIAGLAVAALVITMVSAVLTAALLTISVSFVALVACRVVYPLADRLEPVMVGDRL